MKAAVGREAIDWSFTKRKIIHYDTYLNSVCVCQLFSSFNLLFGRQPINSHMIFHTELDQQSANHSKEKVQEKVTGKNHRKVTI